MAIKGRIPIPKSQEEISKGLIKPYDKLNRGNPNTPLALNRGEQISFRDDTTKPFSLGIQDIDEAIFYYFENVIKPSVSQNGQTIPVPIKYGSPERWKDIQRDGYYRDDKGKIMAPLIVVKRNSIKTDTTLNKLDANHVNNFEYFQKSYNKKNTYSKFNLLNNTKPSKEFYAVVIPDFVTITYSCVIYTYYIKQLNKIVEAVNYAANGYWGDPERFKFSTLIDTFNIETNTPNSDLRTVKATFDLTLKGYLIPDAIQRDLVSPKKGYGFSKINFGAEVVSSTPQSVPPSSRSPELPPTPSPAPLPPLLLAKQLSTERGFSLTTDSLITTQLLTQAGVSLLTENSLLLQSSQESDENLILTSELQF